MMQEIEELIMTRQVADQAIKEFEAGLPRESAVFLFGKVMGSKAIATEIAVPNEEDYVNRSPAYCQVSYGFLASKVPEFWDRGKDLLVGWHCHPID